MQIAADQKLANLVLGCFIFSLSVSILFIPAQRRIFPVEGVHLNTWQLMLKGEDFLTAFNASYFRKYPIAPEDIRYESHEVIHLPCIFFAWKILCKDFNALKILYVFQASLAVIFAYLLGTLISSRKMLALLAAYFIALYQSQPMIFLLELWVPFPLLACAYYFWREKYNLAALFGVATFLVKENMGIMLAIGLLALILEARKDKSLYKYAISWAAALLTCSGILVAFHFYSGGNAIRSIFFKTFDPELFLDQYIYLEAVARQAMSILHNIVALFADPVKILPSMEQHYAYRYGLIFLILSLLGIFKQKLPLGKLCFALLGVALLPVLITTVPYGTGMGRRANMIPLQYVFSISGIDWLIAFYRQKRAGQTVSVVDVRTDRKKRK